MGVESDDMGRIDKEKFKLVHSNVDLFHSSEWEGDDSHPSTWYVVYRTCLALAMVTGISLHFVSTLETLGSKWFIYMTNQGTAGTYNNPHSLTHLRHQSADPPLPPLCRDRGR